MRSLQRYPWHRSLTGRGERSPRRARSSWTRHPAAHGGFTLVEVLVVIAIIGVLVGLLVPAVNMAYNGIKKRAIAAEVLTLASAIDRYKEKYGDYPPDGSDAAVFSRHLRRIFPQIADSELAAITAASNCSTGAPNGVMDPPEALVFFLGGFSDDPASPITGPGGPLFDSGGGNYQYNVDRNSPLYEFKQSQLTLDTSGGTTVSNDETLYGLGSTDLMPVYRPKGKMAPYVYFDGRTYSFASGGTFYNHYTSSALGVARPYRSDDVRTTATVATNPDAYYRYVNEESFQLITAGMDDSYGGVPFSSGLGPMFYCYPSGQSLDCSIAAVASDSTGEYPPGKMYLRRKGLVLDGGWRAEMEWIRATPS